MDTSGDLAQKKFGSAKAISSEQFFNDRSNDFEHQANLNRFQGSSSISSSEYFGNGQGLYFFCICGVLHYKYNSVSYLSIYTNYQ